MSDLATTTSSNRFAEIAVTERGAAIATLADAWTIAQTVKASGMAPRGLDTPQKIMVALMAGAEAGLPPMAALKSTMVVNGVPTLYGDGPISLVLRSGKLKAQRSGWDGQGDKRFAWFEVERKDVEGVTRREFSVADAKAAGLFGKAGPWKNHMERMLLVRARAYALRDAFADVLAGFSIAEEVQDIPRAPERPAVGSEGLLAALVPDEPGEAAEEAVDVPWHEADATIKERDARLFEDES